MKRKFVITSFVIDALYQSYIRHLLFFSKNSKIDLFSFEKQRVLNLTYHKEYFRKSNYLTRNLYYNIFRCCSYVACELLCTTIE